MRSHTKTRDPVTKPTTFPGAMGQIVFALAFSGLGALGLLHADFALPWQPIPQWLPWRQSLAYLSGAITLAGAVGLLVKPIAARCALVLTIYLFLGWVLPQAIKVATVSLSVGSLLGLCETLAAMTGGWILWTSLRQNSQTTKPVHHGSVRFARRVFGTSCVIFGISHFVYANFTAGMIPAWLPFRLSLAYATGVGHAAAGLAIVFGIRPRLAATLEALMMSSFVVVLHIPSLWAAPPPDWAPSGRILWTAFFWASALAGSAWIVAHSLAPTRLTPLSATPSRPTRIIGE